MTLSTKAFLMIFSGTEKIDRGSKQNHYGKHVYKGCKFHSWYFISSVDESQNKDRSEILGKGHSKVGNFTHNFTHYKIYNITELIKQSPSSTSILMKYKRIYIFIYWLYNISYLSYGY